MMAAFMLVFVAHANLRTGSDDAVRVSVLAGGQLAAHKMREAGMVPSKEECTLDANALDIPRLRLVINSNEKYLNVGIFKILHDSILKSGFSGISDTLLVVGQSGEEIGPHRGVKGERNEGYMTITTKRSAQGYTGLLMLKRYRNSPEVRAHAYLYIHDTATVVENFPSIFDQLQVADNDLQVPKVDHASIIAFGYKFLCSPLLSQLDRDFSKREIVNMEMGDKIATLGGPGIVLKRLPGWQGGDFVDIYHTGAPRNKFLYPYFGIEKYVFWGHHGDLHGKIQPNAGMSNTHRANVIEPSFYSVVEKHPAKRKAKKSRSVSAPVHPSSTLQRSYSSDNDFDGLPNFTSDIRTTWRTILDGLITQQRASGATQHQHILNRARNDTSPMFWRDCQPEPALEWYFRKLDASGGLNASILRQNYRDNPIVRFKIQNNQLSWQIHNGKLPNGQHRIGWYEALLNEVLGSVPFPDMDFFVSLLDGAPVSDLHDGVFRVEGYPGSDLLFVPRSLVDHHLVEKLARKYTAKPCKSRKHAAVFRGSTTGVQSGVLRNLYRLHEQTASTTEGRANESAHTPAETVDFPRFRIALVSKRRPDLLDAGFTQVYGLGDKDTAKMQRWLEGNGLWRGQLSDDEQRCYAAVVVVDGYTVPDRLAKQLAYGIPVVFVRATHPFHKWNPSPTAEFWYNELQEGTDYVAATQDTVEAVLAKLLAEPESTRERIGRNGMRYIQQHLTGRRVLCYLVQALRMYAERYNRTFGKQLPF